MKKRLLVFLLVFSATLPLFSGCAKAKPTFIDDGQNYSGNLVITMDKPQSGTPMDYTPIQNLAIANKVFMGYTSFKGTATGKVVAKVGMIKYNQNMKNVRKKSGSSYFMQAVSYSSLKKVAFQRYLDGSNFLYRKGSNVTKSMTATWSDSITAFTKDEYLAKYGTMPNEIYKYDINEDTIISSNFVEEENGIYTYEFELKVISAKYYSREVATVGGADGTPAFHSVKISLSIDEGWNTLKIVTSETYDINLDFIGAASCTSVITEEFTDINVENYPIPEGEDFIEEIA